MQENLFDDGDSELFSFYSDEEYNEQYQTKDTER